MIGDLVTRAITLPIDIARGSVQLVGRAINGPSEADRLRDQAEQVREDARETEQRRKAQAAKAQRNAQDRIRKQARNDRLDAVETRHEAVVEEAEAAATREEAQRLKQAAGLAKAARRR